MGQITDALDALGDQRKAKVLAGFFKTGKGQYGEGDVFIGVNVPEARKVAKEFGDASLAEVGSLLGSKVHEHRLTGFLILVEQFNSRDARAKRAIYTFYMKNSERANNWDLVDLTADKIVGEYLLDKDKDILQRMARSSNLWKRRIAIVSTFAFIKKGMFEDTLKIAEMLLGDEHDLMHKAAGWMLREVGKRGGLAELEKFLERHRKEMPRTMLRYAIERLSPAKKAHYMG
jgi:3-methyladenine DNA glycosylase AlkD